MGMHGISLLHGAGAARGGMVCVCVVAALWQAHARIAPLPRTSDKPLETEAL